MSFNMPPGFRFHPTDEELVVHFLHRKTMLLPCHPDIIPDLDLYPYDPWDLNGKAMAEGRRCYFYSRKTQSRVTGSGYWQPFGAKDEPIYSSSGQRIGIKKHYEFYIGKSDSEGVKTSWIMQEFRLSDSSSSSTRSSRSRRNSNNIRSPRTNTSRKSSSDRSMEFYPTNYCPISSVLRDDSVVKGHLECDQ